MDHLQAIRIFARVVETGSFTQAAQSLHIPHATASKWVRELEVHLGVKLLERSTRSVTVTTDGAAYYEGTRHLLSELDDMEATLGRNQTSPRGVLRVDTSVSVVASILIPALPAFRARYPDIQLRLSATERTADLIAENIDCAIRSVANDPALISKPIGALSWTTCVSQSLLAQHGTPLHPHDIARLGMPVAGYFSASTGLTQPLQFRRGEEHITLHDVPNAIAVSDGSAHLATALAGLGLVQSLDFMLRPAVERGVLVPVLTEWRAPPLPVYIAYPPSRRYSTKVRVFVDWVTELFRTL